MNNMIANNRIASGIHCPDTVLPEHAQGIVRIMVDDPDLLEIPRQDREKRLVVKFKEPVTPSLLKASAYSLTGGQRIFPRIVSAAPLDKNNSQVDRDDSRVVLTLDKVGDYSIYTLTVNSPDIDPLFASGKLRFRLACDDPFDCRPDAPGSSAPQDLAVVVDYLAKDYAGFRQALLEFIPTRMPAWTENNEADLGMMLLELFSYTADSLSYMQDRVANEAFLDTAAQRRSVAGHLALIDYEMDQGASAYTWLQFKVTRAQSLPVDPPLRISTKPDREKNQVVLFETHGDVTLRPEHNEMAVYTGGIVDCCLPSDALSLTLVGRYPFLRIGDHLLFDDGRGQRDIVQLTDISVESTRTQIAWSKRTPLQHRYCVRGFDDGMRFAMLRGVSRCRDALSVVIKLDDGQGKETTLPLDKDATITVDGKNVQIEKLPVPSRVRLRLSSDDLSSSQTSILSVVVYSPPDLLVHGNLAPATHGETIADETILEGQDDRKKLTKDNDDRLRADYNRSLDRGLKLHRAPLAYLNPETPGLPPPIVPPDLLPRRKPRNISTLALTVDETMWHEKPTLLDSGRNDTHFRVEIDDLGDATIRFAKRFGNRDSEFGARPEYPKKITARYRVGGGVLGNVAAETLVQVQPPGIAEALGIQAVTNPLAAVGGRDLESRDRARRFAPATFKKSLVALTPADYQSAAEGYRDAVGAQVIQRAQAAFRWTGSWLTAILAVDPLGATTLLPEQEKDLLAFLDTRRLAGYDIEVIDQPNFVRVELAIDICLKPGFRPDKVEAAVREALGSTARPGGGTGFFHPDNFTFGQNLYVSRIFDAVAAVAGVSSSHIIRLCRFRAANFKAQTDANLAQGYLAAGPDEIIRLDNDRNFPENGTLLIRTTGVS